MKLMGMKGWLHWSVWYVTFSVFMLISVALMTLIFHIKVGHPAVIIYTDPSVTFAFLLLFSLSVLSLSFVISTFFSNSSHGYNFGFLIFIISYLPFLYFSDDDQYMSLSAEVKFGLSLVSNVALRIGCKTLALFESAGVGLQWSNINEVVDHNFSMLHTLIMLCVDTVVYTIMTWYFDAVLPGVFGTPQPFYFPFTRWYWCGYSSSVVNVDDTEADLPDYGDRSARFEPSVSCRKVGIKIRNLTKRFSKNQQPAVDRLSIDLYEGDITALLGHNGAGKTTTMFMLTGYLRLTGGTAYINGLSIRRDMVKIRESLGLCPQHDVLFDTMTVEEHLAFFATLKGCPRHEVNRAVHRMIGVLHLEAKSSTVSKDLSGGTKRKLCVGIALIADSKVVVLDEPTSGMDPEARRQTWDILQSQRAGRTMILSTHFMEEADILDDRIAIMAGGQLQCYGSSLFLKNIYGTGYRLNIVNNILCIPENVLNVIRVHVPGVRLESNVGAMLSFVLPKEQSANFEKLFTDLENNHTLLGIDSFGASLTTLEEVFLKAMETGDDTLQDNLQNSRVQSHTQTSGGTSSTGAASGTSTSDDEMFGVRFRRTTGAASLALQRSRAMLVKHAVHS